VAARVRQLRQYGWKTKYHSEAAFGMNSRMDEIQAAVLRAKLKHLDEWNGRRREIGAAYGKALGEAGLQLPPGSGLDDVVHLYVIRSQGRDVLKSRLAEQGIGTDIHYPVPDHLQQSMAGVPFRRTALPLTEEASRMVLTLPSFPEMTDGEVGEVARSLQLCAAGAAG
jgi:aminotransferase EvaB